MRAAKAAAISVAVLFALIQLFPVSHSNPPVSSDPRALAPISGMLKRACYDCHSNQTGWPWYSFVAPASWVVSRHITEARQHLNFSEWDAYASDPETAAHKLAEVADQVASGKMAPWYYRVTHPAARLNRAERYELIRWARDKAAYIRASE
jgi:hypothetical protein